VTLVAATRIVALGSLQHPAAMTANKKSANDGLV